MNISDLKKWDKLYLKKDRYLKFIKMDWIWQWETKENKIEIWLKWWDKIVPVLDWYTLKERENLLLTQEKWDVEK